LLRPVFTLFFIIVCFSSKAQTIGGKAIYNFLKLPASPALSAVGGVNVSYSNDDIGWGVNNPAILNERLHSQLALSFNSFFAATKAYHLAGAIHSGKINTTFSGSVFFIDYGNILQTDPAGNEEGKFHPTDFAVQISAAKKYLDKWQYGLSMKFIHSNYGQYRSTGLAFDAGIFFNDTTNFFSAGLVAKNMGIQLSAYDNEKEDLPFDLQAGITKRLAKAPLGFSINLQQIHQFNILYNDTTFNNGNGFTSNPSFLNKFFNHFVFATHVYLGKNLEVNIGYNRLRRDELNTGSTGNGLNGISTGFRAQLSKLNFQYSRAWFNRASAYNQLGINIYLNKLFNLSDL
jgi:hypothetical protein